METCATYECIARLDLDAIDAALAEVISDPQPSLRAS
jgi:hypothetical protein